MTTDPHTLVGPYVLDALPADERDQFEEHLVRCPGCRTDSAELLATASHLGQATAVIPPSALRAQVLAQVEVTRQVGPRAPARLASTRRSWPAALAAAAAVAVIVALGALVAQADGRADRAEEMAAIVSASDARTVSVTGLGGAMRLVVSEDHRGGVIASDDMPAPPAGKTYALWFREDGRMVPHGLFEPDADGSVRAQVAGVPSDVVGVTIEPDGGSDEPTLPIIAQGQA